MGFGVMVVGKGVKYRVGRSEGDFLDMRKKGFHRVGHLCLK